MFSASWFSLMRIYKHTYVYNVVLKLTIKYYMPWRILNNFEAYMDLKIYNKMT